MTSNTQSPAATGSIDSTLNETELGRIVANYKMPLAIGLAAVVVGVLIWGIVSHNNNKKAEGYMNKLYAFQTTTLAEYEEDKVPVLEFISAYQKLVKEVEVFEGALPTVLMVSDILLAKGETTHAALQLATYWESFKDKNSYTVYLLGRRLAVAYENDGQPEAAIEILEHLNMKGIRFLEDNLYLDLGRLSLKLGDKETAKRNFKYVLDNGKDANTKRLAELYMEKI